MEEEQEATPAASSEPRPPRKAYRHLKARVRHVPRATIEDRWTPLEAGAIASVTALLRLAERPVLERLAHSERRHDQARAALRSVSRRLTTKITRGLPFPPAAVSGPGSISVPGAGNRKLSPRELEMDFEGAAATVRSLEAQLDPLRHAVELLRVEKEAVDAELARDYAVLQTLETNARAEGRLRRERLRKAHVLVPETLPVASKGDGGLEVGHSGEEVRSGLLFKVGSSLLSHP